MHPKKERKSSSVSFLILKLYISAFSWHLWLRGRCFTAEMSSIKSRNSVDKRLFKNKYLSKYMKGYKREFISDLNGNTQRWSEELAVTERVETKMETREENIFTQSLFVLTNNKQELETEWKCRKHFQKCSGTDLPAPQSEVRKVLGGGGCCLDCGKQYQDEAL